MLHKQCIKLDHIIFPCLRICQDDLPFQINSIHARVTYATLIRMNGRETEEEENRSNRDKENGVRSAGGGHRGEKRESVVRVSER